MEKFKIKLNKDGSWELVSGDAQRFAELFPKIVSFAKDGKLGLDGMYSFGHFHVRPRLVAKNVFTKEPPVHQQGVYFILTGQNEDYLSLEDLRLKSWREEVKSVHPGHCPPFRQIYAKAWPDNKNVKNIIVHELNECWEDIFNHPEGFPDLDRVEILSCASEDFCTDEALDFIMKALRFFVRCGPMYFEKAGGMYELGVEGLLTEKSIERIERILNRVPISKLTVQGDYIVAAYHQLAEHFEGRFKDTHIHTSHNRFSTFTAIDYKDGDFFFDPYISGDDVAIASLIYNVARLTGYNFTLNNMRDSAVDDHGYKHIGYAYAMSGGKLKVDIDLNATIEGNVFDGTFIRAGEDYLEWDVAFGMGEGNIIPPHIEIEFVDGSGNKHTQSLVEIREWNGEVVGYVKLELPWFSHLLVTGSYGNYLRLAQRTDNMVVKTDRDWKDALRENQILLGKYPRLKFEQHKSGGENVDMGIVYTLDGDKFAANIVLPDEYLRLDTLLLIVNEIDINGKLKYDLNSKTLELDICTGFYEIDDTMEKIIRKKPLDKIKITTCDEIYVDYHDRIEELILLAAQLSHALSHGIEIEYTGHIPRGKEFGVALSYRLAQYGVTKFIANGFNLMNQEELIKYIQKYFMEPKYFYTPIRNDTILELHENDEGYSSIEPVQKMKENQRTIYRLFAEKKEYNVLSVKQQKVVQVLKLMEKRVTGSGLTYVLLKYIIEYGQVNPDKYEHWLAGTLTFDEALNLSIDLTLHAIGTIFDKDKKVIGLDDSVADKPPKDIKVEYDISKKDDGSYEVKYIAKDADGKDATDRFHTMTIGNTFLHKEL